MGMAAEIPFDIVGFDLDGTLVDSSIQLAASLNYALKLGRRPPIDEAEVKQLVGMGARHMLEMALAAHGDVDRDEVKRLMPALLNHYEEHLGSDCPPFPGLLNALDRLRQAGVKLAVVTNKYEHLAVKLLKNIGMLDRFVTVIGGDTMGPGRGKPQPDPIHEMISRCGGGKAAFIGDSIHDTSAATAAHIPSIAVSFGFLHQPVEDLGATAIIDHYDELIPALQRIG